MNQETNLPKNFIKTLQIISIALIVSIVLLAIYVWYITQDILFFSTKEDKMFLFMAIIISFAAHLSSKYIFSKLIEGIDFKATFSFKVTKFTSAHIVRMALLEFPAIMCLVFVMISGNSFYFILAGILVFIMRSYYPTKEKFKDVIPLNTKEKSMLESL